MLSTSHEISGYEVVQVFGLVTGNTVQSRNVGSQILAGLKSMIGGEIAGYTKLMARARQHAIDQLSQEAVDLGANAVICLRMETSDVMRNCVEMLIYGTAVKLKKVTG